MEIRYTLRMPQPNSHYFEVEIRIDKPGPKKTTLKMASWTPGSYLLREYAKNVESVVARDEKGILLPIRKSTKNSWDIPYGSIQTLVVTYKVYAFEMAVRNCYLDSDQGYLNPASVFLYVNGAENQKATLKVEPPSDWKQVVTALNPIGNSGKEFEIQNLDELIDSPILCGNPLIIEFDAAGVKHRAAFQGKGNVNPDRIKADFIKIIETEKGIFNHHPCKNYTFIVHNLPSGGGGLEHMNSTSLIAAQNTYDNENVYTNFLSLVAHEYFHLWNVKRLRPFPLGPFDYDTENYTSLLWIAEGFTSYYDDFVLFRAGITKRDKFLDVVASNLSRVESVPGMYVQTVAEASTDAWIKYYRPNENSNNATSDYYTKGAALATILDLMLIKESNGTQNLDLLMKDLYTEFYLKLNKGYTEKDIENAFVKRLGSKGKEFLDKYVYGLERPDWAGILESFGIRLLDRNHSTKPLTLGLRLAGSNGRFTVQNIPKNGPAFLSGIQVGDEIISIGTQKVESSDLNSLLQGMKVGEKVELLYNRFGELRSAEIVVAQDPGKSFRLDWMENATPEQDKLRKKWLRME